MRKTLRGFSLLAVPAALCANGCATHTETGALTGGALGAATGALIGSTTGNTGAGAALGAGIGAVGGGLIGAGQDEVDRKNAARIQQAQAIQQQGAMAIQDVVYMTRSGIGDETIIAQIRSSNSYFQLSPPDIVELRQQGVSERVIQAMLATTRRPRRAVVYDPGPPVYVVSPPPPVSIGFGYHHCWPHHHRHCW